MEIGSKALIGLGACLFVLGMAALVARQPIPVWIVPSMGGLMLVGVMPQRLRGYREQFNQAELRRMAAMDARRA